MIMRHIRILLLLTLSCGVLGRNIPDYLIDCYTNQTLMERDNRLPATLNTLINIIRKLEQLDRRDIRVMSTSLLSTFRVDGITFNPDIKPAAGVSPYGIQGYQKEKDALLTSYFIPENTQTIDVNLLTPFEKCALHFFLSDSIEFHKRGSENTDCSKSQSYRMRRTRRDITASNTGNAVSNLTEEQEFKNKSEEVASPKLAPIKLNATTHTTETPLPPPEVKSLEKYDSPDKLDTEVNSFQTESQDLLSGMEPSVESFQSSNTNYNLSQPETKEGATKSSQSAKLMLEKATVIETSQCPIENGVIYNKWGSLTASNLIAGIATGMQEMTNIQFDQIYPESRDANTSSLTMDNRWAATLAGDLGEVVIHQGPKMDTMKVGTQGGWNDSVVPHWYFINRADQTQMTDAEIRGGLDGLIIAKNIRTWTGQKGNLLLSQLIQQYYSEKGVLNSQYKACSRREQYAAVTPESEMRPQVEAFAYTLYTSAAIATSMKLEAVKQFSSNAISALNAYVASLDRTSCNTAATNISVVPEVDLYVVIEKSWQFNDIQDILITIAEMVDLNSIRGSRVSVYTGNSFTSLVNASSSYIEFYQYFNKTSYDRVGDTGFNLRTLLDSNLKTLFQEKYNYWMDTRLAGGPAPVVLFVPNNAISISDADLNAAQTSVSTYWNDMPDITFLYLVKSGGDRVQSLVISQDDVITYTMPSTSTDILDLTRLDERLKNVHKKITNPICSYNKRTETYSSVEFLDYVQLGYISYYKVSPKYLFAAGTVHIKITGIQGTVQVCYSRSTEYPSANVPNGGSELTCLPQQSGNLEISLSSPCNGYEKAVYCPALYISIQGLQSGSECTVKECKDVTDIQFKISHDGLTCGVAQILGNKMLLLIACLALLRSIISI